ncbi:MAG: magnesium transporter [Deltaproteobacteria bacterium]|nr:MAG: magnesium transporter [Deltaproteobacteria bacterium]
MAEILQLVDAIRRLARRGATSALERTIAKSRAEDIAAAMQHLAPAQVKLVFDRITDDEVAAEVLTRVDNPGLEVLVEHLPFERLVQLLDLMEVDDEADVIARLPEELRTRVMAAIEGEDKEHVEDILAWPEDSAGGIMQPVAFRLNENTTCREAIAALHEQQEDLEMIFYIYVENDAGQLVGVTSLRALLTHPPSTPLKEIMATDVIAVTPDTDQEEVARQVSRYDLLAIPVVDEHRKLLGIVTIDDVVDVIREEAAEDMMLMAGVGEDIDALSGGVLQSTRKRLPWLIVTLCGGMIISEIFNRFQTGTPALVVLAAFVPVMIGMGGNVGIQAATITVRNIAMDRVAAGGTLALIRREAGVGLTMGVFFALVLGTFAALRYGDPRMGLAIAGSGVVQLTVAASVGTLVPLAMQRLGVDPAVATGPFVTTGIDLIGLTLFFSLASAILHMPPIL